MPRAAGAGSHRRLLTGAQLDVAHRELRVPSDWPIVTAKISPPDEPEYEIETLATPLLQPDDNAPTIFIQDAWYIAWRIWIRRTGSATALEMSWQLGQHRRLVMVFGDPDHTTESELTDLWQKGRRLLEIYAGMKPGPKSSPEQDLQDILNVAAQMNPEDISRPALARKLLLSTDGFDSKRKRAGTTISSIRRWAQEQRTSPGSNTN